VGDMALGARIDRLLDERRYAEAEQVVLDAVGAMDTGGGSAEISIHCGRIALKRNRATEALAHFQRAVDLAPDEDVPKAWRVAALHRSHRCDEAREAGERALVTFPDSVIIRVALARTLNWMGVPDQALRHLDEALALDPADPDVLKWRVIALGTQHRHDDAEAAAKAALHQHPGHPGIRVALAVIHERRKRYDAGLAELESVLRTDPDHVEAIEARLRQLSAAHRFDEAEALAGEATASWPHVPELWIQSALGHLAEHRAEDALRILDQAVAHHPDHPRILEWRAVTLGELSRVDEAEALLRSVVSQEPGEPDPYVALATLLDGAGRTEEALPEADTAVRLSPYRTTALGIRIRLLGALSQAEEARHAAEEAVRLRPYDGSLRRRLANTLHSQGRHAEALDVFREVVRRNPYDTTAWSWCVLVLKNLRRYTEAERCATDALALVPDATAVIVQLGFMYQWQTRYAEAVTRFDHAIRIDPANLLAREWRVVCLRMDGQFALAESACREALTRFPAAAGLHEEFALVYLDQGQEDRAIEVLREALAVCHDPGKIRMRLAMTYNALGRYQEALYEFESVLDERPHDASALSWRITVLENMRRFADAEKAAADAVRTLPHHTGLLIDLAWTRAYQGDDEDALRLVRAARDRDPGFLRAVRSEALVLRRLSRPDEALTVLRAQLSRSPNRMPLLIELSLTYRDLGRYEEQLAECRKARELDPWSIWATRAEIGALRDLNRFDEAEEAARRGIRRFPHDAGMHADLGRVCDDRNRYEDALTWFDKALEFNAFRRDVVLAKSATLRSLRRFGDAERLVRTALARAPGDRELRGELGWICRDFRRFTEARTEFERLLAEAANPGERLDSLRGLGWVAFSQGDSAEAIRHFRTASKAEPRRTDVQLGLAWSLLRDGGEGHLAEVEQLCLAALETEPTNHTAHTCLGVLHANSKNFALAEHHLKRSVEIDEYDGSYVDLGALYVQLGRFDEATALLDKALERDWYDVQAHIELGNLHLQRDVEGEEPGAGAAAAVTHFRQCLLINPANGAAAIGLSLALARAPGDLVGAERVLRAALDRRDCDRPRWQLLLALARLLIERGDAAQRSDLYVEALSMAQDAIDAAGRESEPYFVAGVATFKIGENRTEVQSRPFHRRRAVRYLRRCVQLEPGHAEARRVLMLVRQSLRISRGSMLGSAVLIGISATLLLALWLGFFLKYQVTTVMLGTLTPVLAGMVALGFLLPFLVRLKLPGGIEADLSASLSQVSSGPTGDVSIGPGRFAGRGADAAMSSSSLSAGPRGELPRLV
jgi:tetratricopeptide (TPR) repeat protein